MADRDRCPLRHANGNCLPVGGFCTSVNDQICNGLQQAYDHGKGNKLGRWKQVHGVVTPGGTPYYVCGSCGNTGHLHGAEYPKRKMICDVCGAVNIYPYEKAYEEGSSLWNEGDAGAGGLMPAT